MRSAELQIWIDSKKSPEGVHQALSELTGNLRKEFLQEALNDPDICQRFESWPDEGKDTNTRKWHEDLAMDAYCKTPALMGGVPLVLLGETDRLIPAANIMSSSGIFVCATTYNSGDKRPHYWKKKIFSRSTVNITYTGYQLYQFDWDVLHLLIKYSESGFNQYQYVSGRELLRRMGLSVGGRTMNDLKDSILRLRSSLLCIENNPRTGSNTYHVGSRKTHDYQTAFSLVSDFEFLDGEIKYMLDARFVRLFGNSEYGLIDWDKRVKLRKNELAKQIQVFISDQKANMIFRKVEHLRMISGLNSDMAQFSRLVRNALEELLKVEVIRAYWMSKPKRGNATEKSICVWVNEAPVAEDVPKIPGILVDKASKQKRVYAKRESKKAPEPEQIDLF